MNTLQLIARILHIGFGVFWAGTIFFVVFLLEPSIRSVGPDGGKVMLALQKRNFMTILPVAAGLTILSGFYLYWISSGGLAPGWMVSSFGITLTIGAISSLVGFVIGLFFMRPTALRVGQMSASIGTAADDAERNDIMAEINVLKSRSRTLTRWVALFLGVAVVTMAIARYL